VFVYFSVHCFKVLIMRLPNILLAIKPEKLRWNSGFGLVTRGMKAIPVKF
jgi:hypothetical protein